MENMDSPVPPESAISQFPPEPEEIDMPIPEEPVQAQAVVPVVEETPADVQPAAPVCETREPVAPAPRRAPQIRRPAARIAPPILEHRVPGVSVSRQVYEMAGFPRDQLIGSAGMP